MLGLNSFSDYDDNSSTTTDDNDYIISRTNSSDETSDNLNDTSSCDSDSEQLTITTSDPLETLEHQIEQLYEENSHIIDRIYVLERDFIDKEKVNDQLYIGYYFMYNTPTELLMADTVSSTTFFKFSYKYIEYYLLTFNIVPLYQPKLQIMKLKIDNTENSSYPYTVLLKTHWISLVQRHWKKVLSERKKIHKKMSSIQARHIFENTGKYGIEIDNIPTLKGMLSMYAL